MPPQFHGSAFTPPAVAGPGGKQGKSTQGLHLGVDRMFGVCGSSTKAVGPLPEPVPWIEFETPLLSLSTGRYRALSTTGPGSGSGRDGAACVGAIEPLLDRRSNSMGSWGARGPSREWIVTRHKTPAAGPADLDAAPCHSGVADFQEMKPRSRRLVGCRRGAADRPADRPLVTRRVGALAMRSSDLLFILPSRWVARDDLDRIRATCGSFVDPGSGLHGGLCAQMPAGGCWPRRRRHCHRDDSEDGGPQRTVVEVG
jgi:hypothetical protein